MYSKQDSATWDSNLLKSALSEFWDSIENPSSKDISGMSGHLGWALGCDWTEEETKLYFEMANQISSENFLSLIHI